jgi:hypothetical protein
VSAPVSATSFTEAVTGEAVTPSAGSLSVSVPAGGSRLLVTTP